jgi:Spy/CpxP family protein refolding chaperone
MMKRILNTGKITAGIALAMLVTSLQAQPGYGKRMGQHDRTDSTWCTYNPLNLTEVQEKKIAELHTAHRQEMLTFHHDLSIKKAELQKFKTADKPDMALIEKTIDEIGKLTTAMQKKRMTHELAVRDLLTAEQKTLFDTRHYARDQRDDMDRSGFNGHRGGRGMYHSGRGYGM